jgi:hypothetical protein
MFGVNKRSFLILLMVILASSCGCSRLVGYSGHKPSDLQSFPATRAGIQEIFGKADEIKACPGGKIVEYRWIRQQIGSTLIKEHIIWNIILEEIFVFPFALKSRLPYAFVFDETGQFLYRYDLKIPVSDQYNALSKQLADELYGKLKEGKCTNWTSCITEYKEEARERASCIGYTLDTEVESEFEDILIIGGWVDSGQIPAEEGLDEIREVTTCRRYWYRY